MEVEASSERGDSSSAAPPPQLPPPGPPAKKKRALTGMPGDYSNLRLTKTARLIYLVNQQVSLPPMRAIDRSMASSMIHVSSAAATQIPTRR
jgi:hypothetical protein